MSDIETNKRLDRIIHLLEQILARVDGPRVPARPALADDVDADDAADEIDPSPSKHPSAPPSRPASPSDAPADEQSVDASAHRQEADLPEHYYVMGAKVVRLLLREEHLAVGRIIRSISEEVQRSNTQTSRLMDVLIDALPFLVAGKAGGTSGSLYRVRPDGVAQASRWLEKAELIASREKRFVGYIMSDAAFLKSAPALVETLLAHRNGITLFEALNIAGLTAQSGRGVLARLQKLEPSFVYVEPAPQGVSPVVRVTEPELASRWLKDPK
ncbi:MAG: hypothetical protein ACHREM_00585 [Polyangiales bacterium]